DRRDRDPRRRGRVLACRARSRAGRLPRPRRSRPWPGAGAVEDEPLLLRAVFVAVLAAAALAAPVLAFDNTEPLADKQWYLTKDSAWTFWPTQPKLSPISVAVIDSGIDGTHPDLAGRVVAAKSFVGGSPLTDEEGHGTFVAGEIAAATNNAVGIAGIAFPAKLVVAKVVRGEEIPLDAETAAI